MEKPQTPPRSVEAIAAAIAALLADPQAALAGGTARRIQRLAAEAGPHTLRIEIGAVGAVRTRTREDGATEAVAEVSVRAASRRLIERIGRPVAGPHGRSGRPAREAEVHPLVAAYWLRNEVVDALATALARADRDAKWDEARAIGTALAEVLETDRYRTPRHGSRLRWPIESGRLGSVDRELATRIDAAAGEAHRIEQQRQEHERLGELLAENRRASSRDGLHATTEAVGTRWAARGGPLPERTPLASLPA